MTTKEKIDQKQKKIAEIKDIIVKKQEEIKKIENEIVELNRAEIDNVLSKFKLSSADELEKLLAKARKEA